MAAPKRGKQKVGESLGLDELKAQYDAKEEKAKRLLVCVREEVEALLVKNGLTLGVPLEGRIKSWNSIAEKMERKAPALTDIEQVSDLVGLRAILLFKGDVESLSEIIRENFEVLEIEDTSARLEDSQFGYLSYHYVAKLKTDWTAVPRYSDLGDLRIELQVRTLAQHIWAAASHKLQYKREESVPLPLRRAIYRASALLETVDLEFDRIIRDRELYIKDAERDRDDDIALNVDVIDIVAREMLPAINYEEKAGNSRDEVLRELNELKIFRAGQLREVLSKNMSATLKVDRAQAEKVKDSDESMRVQAGGFYTHVGLIRQAIIEEFGREKLTEIMKAVETGRFRKKTS